MVSTKAGDGSVYIYDIGKDDKKDDLPILKLIGH